MDGSLVEMRPVTSPEQIAKVAELARIVWPEHYTPLIGRQQVDYMLGSFHSQQAIETEIADKGFEYFLLRDAARDIGYLSFQLREEELFLSKLYILSSERGRGFGRQAIAVLEDKARRGNKRRISLTVAKQNAGSISAYEKIGFRKAGKVRVDIGGGFVLDDYEMELVI